MTRIFFLLTGFGFTLIGSVYMIAYLNLMTIGYSFVAYIQFILSRMECLIIILGILFLILAILLPGGEKKDELHIRYFS